MRDASHSPLRPAKPGSVPKRGPVDFSKVLEGARQASGAKAAALLLPGRPLLEVTAGRWGSSQWRSLANRARRERRVARAGETVALPLRLSRGRTGALVLQAARGPASALGAVAGLVACALQPPARRQDPGAPDLRRRYEDLVHSIQGIVWEADAETFRFTYVSPQAERVLGYPVACWLDEPDFWVRHVHPEDRSWAVSFCKAAVDRCEDHEFEYRMTAADGRVVWLHDIVTVVQEAGRPTRLRGVMVDVTDRREAEAERKRLYERIRRQAQLAERVLRASERLNTRLSPAEAARAVGLGILEVAGTDRGALLLPVRGGPPALAWQAGLDQQEVEAVVRLLTTSSAVSEPLLKTTAAGDSTAAWPAMYEGQVVAHLVALRSGPEWTAEECEAMRAFARQAALALNNAHLLEQALRRARRQEALQRLSTSLARAQTEDEVCRSVVVAARRVLGVRAVGVYLLDPETGDRVLRARAGWPELPVGHRIPPGAGTSDRAVRTGRTVYTPDVRQDPAYIPGAPDARSELDVPIRAHGAVAGVLVVEREEVAGFDPEEVAVLEATANLVGVALERARLLEDTRARADRFAALLEFGAALRSTRSPEEMYPVVVREVAARCGASRAALALTTPAGPPTVAALFGSAGSEPDREALVAFADLRRPLVVTEWPLSGEPGPTAVVPVETEQESVGLLLVGRAAGAPGFTRRELELVRAMAEVACNALRRAQLVHALEQAYMDVVLAPARAVDARDTDTANHSERIAVWAERTARALGCPEDEVRQVRWAALLHDIGKVGVPDHILRKPGPLTEQEWEVIRRHPSVGEEILKPLGALREVARIVRHHQERWDGSGYPDGLAGEQIPLGARIIAVADSYGAITDHRPYRPARPHHEAVQELRRCAGTQFDPRVVEAFLAALEAELATSGCA